MTKMMIFDIGGRGGGNCVSGDGGCDGSNSGDSSDDKGNHNNPLKVVAATAMATDGNDDNEGQ